MHSGKLFIDRGFRWNHSVWRKPSRRFELGKNPVSVRGASDPLDRALMDIAPLEHVYFVETDRNPAHHPMVLVGHQARQLQDHLSNWRDVRGRIEQMRGEQPHQSDAAFGRMYDVATPKAEHHPPTAIRHDRHVAASIGFEVVKMLPVAFDPNVFVVERRRKIDAVRLHFLLHVERRAWVKQRFDPLPKCLFDRRFVGGVFRLVVVIWRSRIFHGCSSLPLPQFYIRPLSAASNSTPPYCVKRCELPLR